MAFILIQTLGCLKKASYGKWSLAAQIYIDRERDGVKRREKKKKVLIEFLMAFFDLLYDVARLGWLEA